MVEWYYAKDDKQIGPVSRDELQILIRSKEVDAHTLVWREGMADWQTLGSISGKKAGTAEKKAVVIPVSVSPVDETESQGLLKQKEAVDRYPDTPADSPLPLISCAQCGNSFPEDEVISYQGANICAACKPLFVQKLKEGARLSGSVEYGGFWIRFGAKIIDGIIMGILQVIISLPIGFISGLSGNPESGLFLAGQMLSMLFSLVAPVVYTTWFLGKYGATPGKMACRLRVITPEGGSITYGRALGRTMAEWISSIILGIGYLMAAFDEEKRTLHDRICNTRVIRVQ